MASIEPYETKAGKRWRVLYRTPDRKQTQKRGFRTKRDATEWLEKTSVDMRAGMYVPPTAGRMTVGELARPWFNRQSHWKPSTRRLMESVLITHVAPKWATTPIGNIRTSEVKAWVADLSAIRSPSVVTRAFGILNGILSEAVTDSLLAVNPCAKVDNLPRKTTRPHMYLTHEQVDALARNAGRYSTLVYLACYTGMRWGEIAGLRVKHLNLLKRRVNVETNAVTVGSTIIEGTPKNHERRSVQLPKFLIPLLEAQCEGKGKDDLVFTAPRKGDYVRLPKHYRGWFRNALIAAGITDRFTPHDMRHTAVSLAIQAGANVKVIQRMVGHKSAALTLDTYADLFESDANEVADALDNARSSRSVAKMLPKAQNEPL